MSIAPSLFWVISDDGTKNFKFETPTPDLDWAKEHRCGVFYVVNELGDRRNENNHLRYSANVTAARASFIDFDLGTKASQYEKIVSLPLPPSRIVESGHGYHVYWELEPYATNLPLWACIQHELAVKYGGDTAVKDYARVMRLVGSWHCKEEPVQVHEVEASGLVYALETVQEAFGIIYTPPRTFELTQRHLEPAKAIPVTRILNAGNRHAALMEMVAWKLSGTAPSQYLDHKAYLKAWYAASCVPLKEWWDQEVEEVCQWVAKREWGDIPV